jgi:hypothetical protein
LPERGALVSEAGAMEMTKQAARALHAVMSRVSRDKLGTIVVRILALW